MMMNPSEKEFARGCEDRNVTSIPPRPSYVDFDWSKLRLPTNLKTWTKCHVHRRNNRRPSAQRYGCRHPPIHDAYTMSCVVSSKKIVELHQQPTAIIGGFCERFLSLLLFITIAKYLLHPVASSCQNQHSMMSFLKAVLLLHSARAFAPAVRRATAAYYSTTSALSMTKDFDLVRGFDTICLHGGYLPDPTTTSRGVPIHRTAPYAFKNTETAANLFGLKELGNIYST